jgi:hypothetical protein
VDYVGLFERAIRIVWNHKFLIVLGVIAALAGGGSGGGSGGGGQGSQQQPPPVSEEVEPRFAEGMEEVERFFNDPRALVAAPLVVGIGCLVGAVFAALWAVGRIAEGGLIAGVNDIEATGSSSFSQAWRAGWVNGWRLIGIGLVAGLPLLLLAVILAAMMLPVAFDSPNPDVAFSRLFSTGRIALILALLCITAIASVFLTFLSAMADRACMLDDRSVIDSYRRGWEVVTANFGKVLVLSVLNVIVSIIVGLLMIVPGFIMVVCCILLPLLIAIDGGITAVYSAVWTLAWREWTGLASGRPAAVGEPVLG